MWKLSAPWWEFILRGAIIYFFLLILLRLTGKRQVGQLAPFDLVLLLILSNAVQNAMNAGDDSVLAGLILAVTLVVLNYLVGFATYKNRKLAKWIEGKPVILIHDGKVFSDTLEKQQISDVELDAALRNGGCANASEVFLAMLENNGHISVLPKKQNAPEQ